MKEEIKKLFPSWISDNKKYYMCLTDDLDSLFSCILLQQIKGYEISHFYSFSNLYRSDNYKNKLKLCGIDMDLVNGRCWGNHVTIDKNFKAANINTIKNIDNYNYYSKYCGSTLLEIISYYNIDISELKEEAKMVLLCVDSTYLMYNFNPANCKKWLVDTLELPDLFELCKHNRKEFENLHEKYNLKKKIFRNEEGKLKTAIDLKGLSELFDLPFVLPTDNFKTKDEFLNKGMNIRDYKRYKKKLEEQDIKIFSQALTNKDFIKFSQENY